MKRWFFSIIGSCLLFSCAPPAGPVETTENGCSQETATRECSNFWFRSVEDIDEFCELNCASANSISFGALEGVESITGFDNLRYVWGGVELGHTHRVKNWDVFNNVVEVRGRFSLSGGPGFYWHFRGFEKTEVAMNVWVRGSRDLQSFYAFQNLRSLTNYEPDSSEFQRANYIDVSETKALEEVGDFYELRQAPIIRFVDNDMLLALPNFPKLEVVRGLAISGNPKVDTLPDLSSLKRIQETLVIENNGAIRQCEVDALLAQLDEPPENIILAGLSDAPCD